VPFVPFVVKFYNPKLPFRKTSMVVIFKEQRLKR
jgi:hypothetical protein